MKNINKIFNVKRLVLLLFLITGFITGFAQTVPTLEWNEDGRSTTDKGKLPNAPDAVTSATVTFYKNTDNPSGQNFIATNVTATIELIQPYNSSYKNAFGLSYEAIGGSGNGYRPVAREIYSKQGGSAYTASPNVNSGTGISANDNYSLRTFFPIYPLFGQSSTGRFLIEKVKVTFSEPVDNPVFHIGGIGNYMESTGDGAQRYKKTYYSEWELADESLDLSVLSGNGDFGEFNTSNSKKGFTNTTMRNRGSTYSTSNIHAAGSVVVYGTGLTEVVFNVYMKSQINRPWNINAHMNNTTNGQSRVGEVIYFGVSFDDFPVDPCAVLSSDLQPYNGQTNTTQIFSNNVIGIGDARMTVTHPYGSERLAQDRISDTHEAGAAGLNLGHATGTNVANTFDRRIETEISFSAPVKNLSFRINDLDNGDRVRVLAYDENDVLIPFTAANYALHPGTLVTYHSGEGVTGEFRSTNTEVGDTRGTIDFNFNGRQVSRVVFQYYDVTDGGTYSIAKFSGIDSTDCPDCTNSGETSVDLNSLFTGTLPHPDVVLEWWSTPDRQAGTQVLDPTDVTASGRYYAFFYDTGNDCYNTNNSTAFVDVTILPPCDTTCTKPGDFTEDGIPTKVGITVQQKQDNWPESIPNGFITLESKEKGFVITRVQNSGVITDAREGMLIYDIDAKCVKLYNGTAWKCIEKGCNE